MKLLFIILLLVSLTLPSHELLGQVSMWDLEGDNFQHRVKNIEFFIDRFNNQSYGHGSNLIQLPPDSLELKSFIEQRDGAILSLFDFNQIKKADKKLKEKINSFILQVNNEKHSHFLNFTDTDWFVTLLLDITLNGQEKTLQCNLSINQLDHQQYGWVIQSFLSPELNLKEKFSAMELHFPPNANGTDFIGVQILLNDQTWTSEKNSILPANSSLTLTKLSTGEMKIDAISNITYHFLQVNGWLFTVNYINRESRNSGWLMDILMEASDHEKASYRERFFANQNN